LADLQSIAFDTADPEPGFARILDAVADFVPALKDLTSEPDTPAPSSVSNSIRDVSGTSVQAGNFAGDVGTVIKDIHGGNIHTGRGDIYHNSRHVSGDGMTYFEGDNHGGVRNQFGKPDRREDEQQ
jgi:hypothetical protein